MNAEKRLEKALNEIEDVRAQMYDQLDALEIASDSVQDVLAYGVNGDVVELLSDLADEVLAIEGSLFAAAPTQGALCRLRLKILNEKKRFLKGLTEGQAENMELF